MRREHPDGFSRPRDQRCGLNRSHAHLTLSFQGSACKDRTLFHVLNDDTLYSLQRHTATTLALGNAVPEIEPPLRKSPLSYHSEGGGFGIYEVYIAKVGACQ